MSFILDALKKSEADRQRQSAPALFEVKVARPRRRVAWWSIGAGALVAANLLVLAWVLLRAPQAEPATAAAPAPAPVAANAAQAPQGMVTVPATVTLPTTVNIPVGSAPAITVGSNYPEPGVVAPSPTPPLAEEPVLSSQELSVPPDYDARDHQPAITPEQAGQIAAARRAGQMPSRDEVLARGGALPDLRLDLHVYATEPAQRFVFINMRKLREGESLPEGVRVEQITPTGALLSYRGTRFSLEGN
jgi:general secretion pathway protein B